MLTATLARAQQTPDEATLRALLPDTCHLQGDFRQRKQVVDLPVPLLTSGSFLFSCEHGLIWQTMSPLPEAVIYRKEGGQRRFFDDGQEERLGGRLHREIGGLLNDIIGADTASLMKRFSLATVEGGLQLVPENRNLQRFLGSITLVRGEAGGEGGPGDISIGLVSEQETTSIDISGTRSLTGMSPDLCREQVAEFPAACDFLLGR